MAVLSKIRNEQTLQNARDLRKNSTGVEKKLWQELRAKRFDGYKFRRQHDIGNYIVDFFCLKQNLIVELDGGQHADQQEYDAKRTEFLETKGFKVLRFWNNEVTQNIDGVLTVIYNSLSR